MLHGIIKIVRNIYVVTYIICYRTKRFEIRKLEILNKNYTKYFISNNIKLVGVTSEYETFYCRARQFKKYELMFLIFIFEK